MSPVNSVPANHRIFNCFVCKMGLNQFKFTYLCCIVAKVLVMFLRWDVFQRETVAKWLRCFARAVFLDQLRQLFFLERQSCFRSPLVENKSQMTCSQILTSLKIVSSETTWSERFKLFDSFSVWERRVMHFSCTFLEYRSKPLDPNMWESCDSSAANLTTYRQLHLLARLLGGTGPPAIHSLHFKQRYRLHTTAGSAFIIRGQLLQTTAPGALGWFGHTIQV